MSRASLLLLHVWDFVGRLGPFPVARTDASRDDYSFFHVGREDGAPAMHDGDVALGEIQLHMNTAGSSRTMYSARDIRRAFSSQARTAAGVSEAPGLKCSSFQPWRI